MMRFLALLVFILFTRLPLNAQIRPGEKKIPAKNAAVKEDTTTDSSTPDNTTSQPVADEKDNTPPPPPSSNGSSILFTVKMASAGTSGNALPTRKTNADKAQPLLAVQNQMANTTPEQLQSIGRRDVVAVKPAIDKLDIKSFTIRNKNVAQPPMPKELLASIKIQDSLRAVAMAQSQAALGNTGSIDGSRKSVGLNNVPSARLDPPDKMATSGNVPVSEQDNINAPRSKPGALPIVPDSKTPASANATQTAPRNSIRAIKDSIKNAKAQKLAGNTNTATAEPTVIVEAATDSKAEPEKYVFDKSVFNEMDSKKYPIIIEVPKDSNSANLTGGDFPKPYTTKKKRVRLFLSADENVELPVEQIVTVRYPRLAIQIKLADENISNIRDIKVMMTLTNNSSKTQTFLFDRPVKPGFAMWGGSCKIVGSNRSYILKLEGKPEYEAREFARKDFEHYAFKIKANEWFIKKFAISDIVVVDDNICPGGNLPRDTYSMQLVFQGNYSNVITFTVY